MIEKMAVVDLETTGPRYEEGDRIIQIGVVLLDKGQVVQTYESKVNPNRSIPYNISQLTGIYPKDVREAPFIEDVIEEVYQLIKDRYLVAHNAAFDYAFLSHTFKEQLQLSYEPVGIIDTVTLSKIFFPQAPAFNLTILSQYLNLTHLKAHDALADALVTADLLNTIMDKINGLSHKTRQILSPMLKALNPIYPQLLNASPNATNNLASTINKSKREHDETKDLNILNTVDRHQPKEKWIQLELEQQFPSYKLQQEVIETLLNRGEEVVVGVHNKEELVYLRSLLPNNTPCEVIYPEEAYIHTERYKTLQNQFFNERIKDKQKIAIAATQVWLEETETGRLDEVHHELAIRPLLEKYVPKANNQSHFFVKAIERAEKAQIVLVLYRHMHILNRKEFVRKRCLVSNIQTYYEDQRLVQQHTVSFKKNRDQLRTIYHQIVDQRPPIQKPLSHLLKQIQRLERGFEQLDTYFTQFVEKNHVQNKEPQEQIVIYWTNKAKHSTKINNLLSKLTNQLTELLKKVALYQEPASLKEPLDALSTFLKTMQKELEFLCDFEQNEILISSERLFEQYLHIKLVVKPINLINNPVTYFEKGITWSSQPENQLQSYYRKKVFTNQLRKIPLKLTTEKTLWTVPAEYLQNVNREISPLERVICSQIDYLMDQPVSPQSIHHLVIANHLNQSIATTKIMQNHPKLSKDYTILGEGVNGSIRKILSRTQNSAKSITVVSIDTYLNSFIGLDLSYYNLLMQSLPFKPLSHKNIQGPKEGLQLKPQEVFKEVVLADMINRMLQLIQVNQTLPGFKEYLLFDQRIFISNYSSTVLECLKNTYEFNFSTDKSLDSWYTE